MKGVLVVEDEVVIRLYLVGLLKRMDIPVLGTVDTGEAAVVSALELEPDLVFMDIRLAGPMDGIEAAGHILRDRKPKIIFMSAYDYADRVTARFADHDVAYMSKPVGAEDLRRVIHGSP